MVGRVVGEQVGPLSQKLIGAIFGRLVLPFIVRSINPNWRGSSGQPAPGIRVISSGRPQSTSPYGERVRQSIVPHFEGEALSPSCVSVPSPVWSASHRPSPALPPLMMDALHNLAGKNRDDRRKGGRPEGGFRLRAGGRGRHTDRFPSRRRRGGGGGPLPEIRSPPGPICVPSLSPLLLHP